MSLSLTLACLWVLAGTITAFLPMRRQYAPGITLLVTAPLLLVYIGIEHGAWIAVLGLAAFVSMFRNALRYMIKRLRGEKPELPE